MSCKLFIRNYYIYDIQTNNLLSHFMTFQLFKHITRTYHQILISLFTLLNSHAKLHAKHFEMEKRLRYRVNECVCKTCNLHWQFDSINERVRWSEMETLRIHRTLPFRVCIFQLIAIWKLTQFHIDDNSQLVEWCTFTCKINCTAFDLIKLKIASLISHFCMNFWVAITPQAHNDNFVLTWH